MITRPATTISPLPHTPGQAAAELWLALEAALASSPYPGDPRDVVSLDHVTAIFRHYCGGTLPSRSTAAMNPAVASETGECQR